MAKKVERTTPGSKNDWRITYNTGSKKWTNDRPGDGVGDPEELEETFDDLTVKRGLQRLEKAGAIATFNPYSSERKLAVYVDGLLRQTGTLPVEVD